MKDNDIFIKMIRSSLGENGIFNHLIRQKDLFSLKKKFWLIEFFGLGRFKIDCEYNRKNYLWKKSLMTKQEILGTTVSQDFQLIWQLMSWDDAIPPIRIPLRVKNAGINYVKVTNQPK